MDKEELVKVFMGISNTTLATTFSCLELLLKNALALTIKENNGKITRTATADEKLQYIYVCVKELAKGYKKLEEKK